MQINLKIIFVFISAILAAAIFSNIVAAEDDLIFTSGQPIDLKLGCIYNGTYCSSSSVCNVTIVYPGSNGILINNAKTTNQLSFYNITIPAVANMKLGTYTGTLVCNDPVAGYSGSLPFTFDVTSSGSAEGGDLKIFILLLVVSCILFILSLVIANTYVGALSAMLLTASGVYFYLYGVGNAANLYTYILSATIIGAGVILLMVTSYKSLVSEDGLLGGNKTEKEDENDIMNYTQSEND